jgi:curli biogenesis system outer membrane secretion channel CsgG
MTRLYLLLTVAGLTAAATTIAPAAPKRAAQKTPTGVAAARAATAVPATDQPINIGWVARYGVYSARTGSWSLIPVGKSGGSLIPDGKSGDGC